MFSPSLGHIGGGANRPLTGLKSVHMNDHPSGSDHDLLIRLEENLKTVLSTMNSFLDKFEKKADKADVEIIKTDLAKVINVVSEMRIEAKMAVAKKQTIISMGEIGVKGWAFIVTTIAATITLIKLLWAK